MTELGIGDDPEFLPQTALRLRAGGIGVSRVTLVPIQVEPLRIVATRRRLTIKDIDPSAESVIGGMLSDQGGHVHVPVGTVLLEVLEDDHELGAIAEAVAESDEDVHGRSPG